MKYLISLLVCLTLSSISLNSGDSSQVRVLKFCRNGDTFSSKAFDELTKCIEECRKANSSNNTELHYSIYIRVVKNLGENDSVRFERIKALNDFFDKHNSDALRVLYRIENVEQSDIRFLNTTIESDSVFGAVVSLLGTNYN